VIRLVITIGCKDSEGVEQAAVFELGKDIVCTILPIIEARLGKKLEYQDKDAKKQAKASNFLAALNS
jgi:hypothetical protein